MKKFYTEARDWALLCLLITLVVCALRMAGQVAEVRRCLNHIEEIMIKRNLKVHDHQPAPIYKTLPDVYAYPDLEPHRSHPPEKKK